MKLLLMLAVLAALGYLGSTYYQAHYDEGEGDDTQEYAPPPQSAVPPAAPAPVFKSRIRVSDEVAPGEKRVAPAGVLYMLERVSAETKNGIMAVVPGDEVKVLKRNGNTIRVAIGAAEFEVKESQVTNDLDTAREAEKKEFLRRTGKR
jgi:hypothetical protein